MARVKVKIGKDVKIVDIPGRKVKILDVIEKLGLKIPQVIVLLGNKPVPENEYIEDGSEIRVLRVYDKN